MGILFEGNQHKVAMDILGHTNRVLFHGPPGTGKTRLGIDFAKAKKKKWFNVTVTEETPAAEARGHYIPKGGEFVWQDGPAVMAARVGGLLVINEVDHASSDFHTFLHGLMDDQEVAAITLPTGETVFPDKKFQVICTMNGRPEDLPEPLLDRLPVRMEISEVHPDAIKMLPKDLREAAARTIAHTNEDRRIGIRQWAAFAALSDKLGQSVAAEAIFGQRAGDVMDALKIREG